ncbi:MAG: hypothetical protein ACJ74Z_16230 [Bryobacteraceae bacterium]|jgi:hypothetical protein
MEQSILKNTKKMLGLEPDDTSFDLDIIIHINSAFSVLHDLGVGPETGFVIEGESEAWEDFLADDLVQISRVKTCVYLRTRLLFDPPAQSFLIDAIKAQLQEAEWRLNTEREATEWTDPIPPVPAQDTDVGFGL